ncbi:hypothetical protein LSTR_LSTR015469 [Laodelphax striatellus]|uniref:UBA domain-containing protein n=1 Tax=Laodelphax striatellus TaxID=195883 RepID=A0A482XTA1_LAOST|nr:hypothetical protein LSTR_LSTR015469 [Laodelphax striatellus]
MRLEVRYNNSVKTALSSGGGSVYRNSGATAYGNTGTTVYGNTSTPADALNRVGSVLKATQAAEDDCLQALQDTAWNVDMAARKIKLDMLLRLGVASRHQCEATLKKCEWNVEEAASLLLDSSGAAPPISHC